MTQMSNVKKAHQRAGKWKPRKLKHRSAELSLERKKKRKSWEKRDNETSPILYFNPTPDSVVCSDQRRRGVLRGLALQEVHRLFALKTARRPVFLRADSLCDPLAQLPAGGVRVGGEDDQAALGVVHVSGVLAGAVPTLRQWIPGYPRFAKTFLQDRVLEKSTFNI